MVRLISGQRGGLAALKLTKLFGINDFPAAKDSGKVLIIIIYCYLIINRLGNGTWHSAPYYLRAVHVPGISTKTGDCLSCLQIKRFNQLAPVANGTPDPFPGRYPPHEYLGLDD